MNDWMTAIRRRPAWFWVGFFAIPALSLLFWGKHLHHWQAEAVINIQAETETEVADAKMQVKNHAGSEKTLKAAWEALNPESRESLEEQVWRYESFSQSVVTIPSEDQSKLTIVAHAPTPGLAAEAVNQVAQQIVRALRSDGSPDPNDVSPAAELERRLYDAEVELANTTGRLYEIREQNRSADLTATYESFLKKIESLELEQIALRDRLTEIQELRARTDAKMLNHSHRELEPLLRDAELLLPESIARSTEITELKADLDLVRSSIRHLKLKHDLGSPVVADAVDQELFLSRKIRDYIYRAFESEREKIVSALHAETEDLLATRDVALRNLKEMEDRRRGMESALREYEVLEGEAQRIRNRIGRLDASLDEQRMIGAGGRAIGIAHQANEAGATRHMLTIPNAALLLVLSLFFGLITCVFADTIHPTIQNTSDAERATDCTVIASVPEIGNGLHPPLRHGTLENAVFETLAAIVESDVRGSGRVIAVTSANANEGATTVASNLAVALAQTGTRVALVDADLNRPQIGPRFGFGNVHGFVNLLKTPTAPTASRQESSDDDLLIVIGSDAPPRTKREGDPMISDAVPAPATMVHSTSVQNLSVVPIGKDVANPHRLVRVDAVREVSYRLLRDFDVVIYDTTPLLAGGSGLKVCSASDLTLMVTGRGKVTVQEAGWARQLLRRAKSPTPKLIFNFAPATGIPYQAPARRVEVRT